MFLCLAVELGARTLHKLRCFESALSSICFSTSARELQRLNLHYHPGTNPYSGKKKAHRHQFFVRLVLGRPRVCPGDFTGFIPGTDSVKTWDKPGFSPYLHSGSPDFTGFVPGQAQFVPGTIPAAQKVYVKNFYVPFSLAIYMQLCFSWGIIF